MGARVARAFAAGVGGIAGSNVDSYAGVYAPVDALDQVKEPGRILWRLLAGGQKKALAFGRRLLGCSFYL